MRPRALISVGRASPAEYATYSSAVELVDVDALLSLVTGLCGVDETRRSRRAKFGNEGVLVVFVLLRFSWRWRARGCEVEEDFCALVWRSWIWAHCCFRCAVALRMLFSQALVKESIASQARLRTLWRARVLPALMMHERQIVAASHSVSSWPSQVQREWIESERRGRAASRILMQATMACSVPAVILERFGRRVLSLRAATSILLVVIASRQMVGVLQVQRR